MDVWYNGYYNCLPSNISVFDSRHVQLQVFRRIILGSVELQFDAKRFQRSGLVKADQPRTTANNFWSKRV